MTGSCFRLGVKVTISSDPAGMHPRRIGTVKRIGNGAWRLSQTSEWYNFEGGRVFPTAINEEPRFKGIVEPVTVTSFAHLYQEGDEELILKENERLKKVDSLLGKKSSILLNIRDLEKKIINIATTSAANIAYAESQVRVAQTILREAENKLCYAKSNLIHDEKKKEQYECQLAEFKDKLAGIEMEIENFNDKK